MAAGDAKSDLLWVIGMVALLAIAWFVTGGPGRPAPDATRDDLARLARWLTVEQEDLRPFIDEALAWVGERYKRSP